MSPVLRGLLSTCSGGPCSMTMPFSMNTTLSAASRAKCISWVTTIIVVPLVREILHDDQDLADELRIQGRCGLVEQEHLRVHAQRSRDRNALLLAARQTGGVLVPPRQEADLVEVALRVMNRLVGRLPRTRVGASMQFPSIVMCGNRLNSWNSIPARSRICRIFSWCRRLRAWSGSASSLTPSTSTDADRRLLEEVDAAQQRGLAVPDRPMTITASRWRTSRSSPRRTWFMPKYFSSRSTLTIGSPIWLGRFVSVSYPLAAGARRSPKSGKGASLIGRSPPGGARAAPGRT